MLFLFVIITLCMICIGYILFRSIIVNPKNVKYKSPVCISITSLPSRIHHIKPHIDSLLQQVGKKPDHIYVCLPKVSLKGDKYIVPSWLSDYVQQGQVELIITDQDYGPGTKLLGCLTEITDPNTIIVFADDDRCYGNTWLQTLVYHAEKYPQAAISFVKDHYKTMATIQGCHGVAVRRKFIKNEIFQFPDKSCQFGDDYWIAYHLQANNIPIQSVCSRLWLPFIVLWSPPYKAMNAEAKGPRAKSNSDNYQSCHAILMAKRK